MDLSAEQQAIKAFAKSLGWTNTEDTDVVVWQEPTNHINSKA